MVIVLSVAAAAVTGLQLTVSPGNGPASAEVTTGTAGLFVPTQGSVLDTRTGIGGVNGPVAANTWYPVQVGGQAGVPSTGVSAVQVSVTVLNPAATGLVKVAANGTALVPIAALTYTGGGGSISASSITALAADGKIRVLAQTSVTLLVHVQGYYTAGNGFPAPGGYVPVAPARVVDTRTGTGLAQAKLATGSTTAISVGGLDNVPADASAVFVMLTAISTSTTAGYLSPYPTGTTRPPNVSLNYLANTATIFGAAVDLGAGGQFNLWIGPAGTAIDVIVDVVGYHTATLGEGAAFTPAVARVYDSRTSPNTALAAHSSRVVQVGGVAGLPAAGSGVTAYAVSAQVVHTGSGAGSLALGPGDQASAAVAAVHFSAGSNVRSSLVMVPPDKDGRVLLVNSSADPINVILDVEGWYTSGPDMPIIESASYPELGWIPPGGSSANFTIVDSGTAATHFRYSLDQEPTITIPSETPEIALTPPTALGAHTLSVTAVDQLGLTSPTNVHKFYIGSPPSAPTGLAIRAGDGSAELTWSAGQDNGAPTLGFRFWIIDRTTGDAPLGLGTCRECTRFVLTGLDPAHTYAAQIAATSAAGRSIPSTSQDFEPVGDPVTCPADDLACESQDIGQPANLDPLFLEYDPSAPDDDDSGDRSGFLTDPARPDTTDSQCALPIDERVGGWACYEDAPPEGEAAPAQLSGYCSHTRSCWSRMGDFHAGWEGQADYGYWYGYGRKWLGTTHAKLGWKLVGGRSNSWPISWRATGPTEDVMMFGAMFNGAPGVRGGGSLIRDSLDLSNNWAIVDPNRSVYWSYSFSDKSMYDHNVLTHISWEVPGYRGHWYQYVRSLVSHTNQLGRSAIYRFASVRDGLPGDKDGAGYRRR